MPFYVPPQKVMRAYYFGEDPVGVDVVVAVFAAYSEPMGGF